MTTDILGRRPYPPSFIHSSYAWVDHLLIPAWLLFILLLPIVGITQHVVAWRKGALTRGTRPEVLARCLGEGRRSIDPSSRSITLERIPAGPGIDTIRWRVGVILTRSKVRASRPLFGD